MPSTPRSRVQIASASGKEPGGGPAVGVVVFMAESLNLLATRSPLSGARPELAPSGEKIALPSALMQRKYPGHQPLIMGHFNKAPPTADRNVSPMSQGVVQ